MGSKSKYDEPRKHLVKLTENYNINILRALFVTTLRCRYPNNCTNLECPQFIYAGVDYNEHDAIAPFIESFNQISWDDIQRRHPTEFFNLINYFLISVCAWPKRNYNKRMRRKKLARTRKEILRLVNTHVKLGNITETTNIFLEGKPRNGFTWMSSAIREIWDAR